MDDLDDLVGHFLARHSEKNRKAISHVSEEAMTLLRNYTWPGNIRELEHAIERAVAMSQSSILFPEDFSLGSTGRGELTPAVSPSSASHAAGEMLGQSGSTTGVGGAGNSGNSLETMEHQHILQVLQQVGYNKSKASEILGIDRATLYRKAQRYGIDLRGK
jgi:DNA-binding NtrC family response regulator